MTWVKVCGLMTPSDVAVAVEAGADAVGFVAVPSSPRFVELNRVADLASGVPTMTVLLTVDVRSDEMPGLLAAAGVTAVQPYGADREAAARAAAGAGYGVLFPVRAVPGVDVSVVPGIPLLDTPATDKLGGTGRSFDWCLAEDLGLDFVLAGGLGPGNVEDAIRRVQPWGVDASSGLEHSPGRKDHGMVADFIARAKRRETR